MSFSQLLKKVEEEEGTLYLQVRLMLSSPGRGTGWPVSFWQVFEGVLKTEFHHQGDGTAVGREKKDNLGRTPTGTDLL